MTLTASQRPSKQSKAKSMDKKFDKAFKPSAKKLLTKLNNHFNRLADRKDVPQGLKIAQKIVREFGERYCSIFLLEHSEKHPEYVQEVLKFLPRETLTLYKHQLGVSIAERLEEVGVQKLEEALRVTDKGLFLSFGACLALEFMPDSKSPIKVVDSLQGVGVDRTTAFFPPLSDAIEDKTINSWGTASVVVSTALGWCPGKPEICYKNLAAAFSSIGRSLEELDKLLWFARFDDSALLNLTGIVQEGMTRLLKGQPLDLTLPSKS